VGCTLVFSTMGNGGAGFGVGSLLDIPFLSKIQQNVRHPSLQVPLLVLSWVNLGPYDSISSLFCELFLNSHLKRPRVVASFSLRLCKIEKADGYCC